MFVVERFNGTTIWRGPASTALLRQMLAYRAGEIVEAREAAGVVGPAEFRVTLGVDPEWCEAARTLAAELEGSACAGPLAAALAVWGKGMSPHVDGWKLGVVVNSTAELSELALALVGPLYDDSGAVKQD